MQEFSTYGGLLRSIADLTNEKFGAAGQKVLIPAGVQTTSSSSPLSEWHTVNVTAVQGAAAVPSSSPSLSDTEEIDETDNDEEKSGEESSDDSGDDGGGDGLFG